MDWREQIRRRVPGLRLSPAREAEIVEELAQHLGDIYDEARASGAQDDEAQQRALDELNHGALARELLRAERPAVEPMPLVEGRRGNMLGSVWQDVRYGVRMLRKNPLFTLVAVLTLALGIGANTAIFSVVNSVLLRPLPYPNPGQIAQVWQIGEHGNRMQTSEPNFEDWRDQNRSFVAMAEYNDWVASVTGGAEPVRVHTAYVGRDFFRVMGVLPARGRGFAAEEAREGGAPAVIVSEPFWRSYLSANADLSALKLASSGQSFSVVGVMPAGFQFPAETEVWVPRELFGRNPSRTAHNWLVVGRVKDGVALAQAQAEMSTLGKKMKQQYGDDIWLKDVALVPLQEQLTATARPALLVLLGAVGFLLLVACANVANLLLAQAAGRQKEIAVRTALGASRGRLVRQFLAESLVLSLSGGALGVVVAVWGVKILLALEPGNLPRAAEVGVDWTTLVFAFAVALATAAALGLVTALRAASGAPNEALKETQRALAGGVGGRRMRSALVVSQLAITLVLLVGAGLLGRSFLELLAVDPGFRTTGSLTMEISHTFGEEAAAKTRQVRLQEELLARLSAVPEISEAGGINWFPLGPFSPDGTFLKVNSPTEVTNFEQFRELIKNQERIGHAEFRVASEGYFRAMGIPLTRGRLFDSRDGIEAPHAALISESLARQSWPGADPIGRMVQFGNMDGDLRVFTIIGVVGDIRERGLDSPARPTFYGYYRQRPNAAGNFVVVMRGTSEPAAMASAARGILRELDSTIPPRFRTIEQVFSASLAGRRFTLVLLAMFAATALGLAVCGVYGVISYAVTQRTREIGIRIALGAQRGDILQIVVGHGLLLAVIGVGIGLGAAAGLTRFLQTMLFGIKPTDPVTFGGVALLLAAVAAVASYVPARRATRVDPMIALRYE